MIFEIRTKSDNAIVRVIEGKESDAERNTTESEYFTRRETGIDVNNQIDRAIDFSVAILAKLRELDVNEIRAISDSLADPGNDAAQNRLHAVRSEKEALRSKLRALDET